MRKLLHVSKSGSTGEYRLQFTQLFNRQMAIQKVCEQGLLFWLSIINYSVTPFAQSSDTALIAREIDIFNPINKEIALQSGVGWLVIKPVSRQTITDPILSNRWLTSIRKTI